MKLGNLIEGASSLGFICMSASLLFVFVKEIRAAKVCLALGVFCFLAECALILGGLSAY